MRVLHPDILGAGCFGAFDSGNRLPRHLFAEFRIVGMGLLRLIPVGDAGHALDIDTDIDFHVMPLLTIKGTL